MKVINYDAACDKDCAGVAGRPAATRPGIWVLCELHNEWWVTVSDNPEPGSESYIWVKTTTVPYAVTILAETTDSYVDPT